MVVGLHKILQNGINLNSKIGINNANLYLTPLIIHCLINLILYIKQPLDPTDYSSSAFETTSFN
jgi:hypothetical protein